LGGVAAVLLLAAACGGGDSGPDGGQAPQEEVSDPSDMAYDMTIAAAEDLVAQSTGTYDVMITAAAPPAGDSSEQSDLEEVVVTGEGRYDFDDGAWGHAIDIAPIADRVGGVPDGYSTTVEYAYVDGMYFVTSDLLAPLTESNTRTVSASSIEEFYGDNGLETGGLGILTAGLAANPLGTVAQLPAVTNIIEGDELAAEDAQRRYRGEVVLSDAYGADAVAGVEVAISRSQVHDSHYGLLGTDPEPAGEFSIGVELVFTPDNSFGTITLQVDLAELGTVLADELPDADQLDGRLEVATTYEPGGEFDYTAPSGAEPIVGVQWVTEF
jgi:hypothetical protein